MKAFIWVYSIHKLIFQILSPFFCWLFFSFEVSFLISEQKFIADLCTNSLLKSFEIFSPHYPFSSLVYHKNILRFLSNRLFFHSFKTSNWTKLLGSERNEPVFRKRQKVSNKHAGSDSTEITRFPCKAPITDIPGRPHTTVMYLTTWTIGLNILSLPRHYKKIRTMGTTCHSYYWCQSSLFIYVHKRKYH